MSDPPYAFDAPDADVIIQAPLQLGSQELKDFRAHKIILSVASTLFHDMFSIPHPPQPAGSDTTLPIIQIAEPAGVFETFLRLIYPIEPPVVDSLQLVDNLFQLAEKYMASGVHARVKQIFASPSFLKDDPILVYAVACRANLDKEARLAIPHTFEIDLVRDVPLEKLQIMTAEMYHRLLLQHSLRRDRLIRSIDEVMPSRHDSCGSCVEQLKKEIRLEISGKPFLDRETLAKCFSSALPTCRKTCFLLLRNGPFISDLLRRID